jgi:hypothetical protein
MAYSTQVFIYTQRQIVVLLSGNSPRSYMPQYAKPLTLNKGVDNQIQFQFLNQEQKPVDITGITITFRLISYDGTQVLINKALDPMLPATGIAVLNVSSADLAPVDPQKAHYSLEIPVGDFDFPVFVDQNAGARGDMNVVDSVLPSFVPSSTVSIPTGQAFPNLAAVSEYGLANYTYTTSVIETDNSPILTIQATYDQYYGNVVIEGSTQVDTEWYPISTYTDLADISDTIGYIIQGYHPFVRMSFNSNSGAVFNILSR